MRANAWSYCERLTEVGAVLLTETSTVFSKGQRRLLPADVCPNSEGKFLETSPSPIRVYIYSISHQSLYRRPHTLIYLIFIHSFTLYFIHFFLFPPPPYCSILSYFTTSLLHLQQYIIQLNTTYTNYVEFCTTVLY